MHNSVLDRLYKFQDVRKKRRGRVSSISLSNTIMYVLHVVPTPLLLPCRRPSLHLFLSLSDSTELRPPRAREEGTSSRMVGAAATAIDAASSTAPHATIRPPGEQERRRMRQPSRVLGPPDLDPASTWPIVRLFFHLAWLLCSTSFFLVIGAQ